MSVQVSVSGHGAVAVRSAATAAIGAGALVAVFVLVGVFGAIGRGSSAEEVLMALDRRVGDLQADLRTYIGSGDSIAPRLEATGASVDATLDSVRGLMVPPLRETSLQAIANRASELLTADIDVAAIARAYRAYADEATRAVETPLTRDTPDAAHMLDLRFRALRLAIMDAQEMSARQRARLLLVLDMSLRVFLSVGALTWAYGLWGREGDLRRASTGPALLPRISDPVILIDRHGAIQQAEGAVDRLFNCDKSGLIGQRVTVLVHHDDRRAVEQFLDQCAKDPRTAAGVDFRPEHSTGVWLRMDAIAGRRKGDPTVDGSVLRLVDVTARKSVQDALRQSTELVRTLIEGSPLAILIEDSGGLVRLWNSAAERMFGWSADEVLGRANPTILEDAVQQYRNLRRQVIGGQAFTGLESDRVTRDGTRLDVSITTAPLDHSDGNAGDVMEVIADITDRKQLEEQLRQAQKMEGIGRLAGGIAHDFNNLLTAINGHAEMLLTTSALVESDAAAGASELAVIRDGVDQISRAGGRAAALTHQLLAFSRSQVLQPTILNLNSAVADMEQMLRRLIGENIDLVVAPSPNLESVKADATQIAQVILNLTLNARDAMPTGGRMTVETANVELDEAYSRKHVPVIPGSYVMLAVSDNGHGMSKDTQGRVFEPFFTTKDKGQGTGLGLATVYGIVRQSGGYIWVYSEPGHGTSFKVYLPSAECRSGAQQGVVARPARPPATGSETVLLVEDEEMVRTLVRQVLTWHGYNVIDAHNGEGALEVARNYDGPIHLMLTDIVMPGMSALDLVKELSAIRPTTKILYMSGYTDHAVVRNNLLNANRAFLQKPFAPDRLAHKIREVLGDETSQPRSSQTVTQHAPVLPCAG